MVGVGAEVKVCVWVENSGWEGVGVVVKGKRNSFESTTLGSIAT